MQLKNKIFNYFVAPPLSKGKMPRVVLSPVTMNPQVAKEILEQQFKHDADMSKMLRANILHVCFDYDSEMIYVPNASQFSKETMDYLLSAAEVRITQDFGGFSSRPPIKGSPFSSLRVRSLNSFSHAKQLISKNYNGKIFKDIPVMEAFLPRMPTTLKSLPAKFKNEEFLGSYISPSEMPSVSFVDEFEQDGRKRKEPIILLTQKTPFILINVADTPKRKEPTATEKEWVVIDGYRSYLNDAEAVQEDKYVKDDISRFAELYSIKRLLYLGWSFEEVTDFMLRDRIHNLNELRNAINGFMIAVDSLKAEGYKDVAAIPYFITFKIDDSFPFDVMKLIDPQTGKLNIDRQHKYFVILDYDVTNSYVLIQTPVFLSPEICVDILKAKSIPFITKYNPIVNKMDIKSGDRSYTDLKYDKVQLLKIKSVVRSGLEPDAAKTLDYRSGKMAAGTHAIDPHVYNVRKISDYLYATDYIKKMCQLNNIPFNDFDVVIGPIEEIFGRGVMGGFMDARSFAQSKIKAPYQIVQGIWISPPVMVINAIEMPSYAEQTETLIHEYRHYIYGIQNPNYVKKYKRPKHDADYEEWYNYLTDPNELAAHRDEIKFELGLGKSYDEIIRNKVGGQITKKNYPIAIKFSELVQEVVKEIEEEKEQNEKPTG